MVAMLAHSHHTGVEDAYSVNTRTGLYVGAGCLVSGLALLILALT